MKESNEADESDGTFQDGREEGVGGWRERTGVGWRVRDGVILRGEWRGGEVKQWG